MAWNLVLIVVLAVIMVAFVAVGQYEGDDDGYWEDVDLDE